MSVFLHTSRVLVYIRLVDPRWKRKSFTTNSKLYTIRCPTYYYILYVARPTPINSVRYRLTITSRNSPRARNPYTLPPPQDSSKQHTRSLAFTSTPPNPSAKSLLRLLRQYASITHYALHRSHEYGVCTGASDVRLRLRCKQPSCVRDILANPAW